MVQVPKSIRLPHDAYANPEAVFHVTFRAAIGERPFDSKKTGDATWQLLVNERTRGAIELTAACIMPDHLHAIVSPRSRDIVKWVDGFKSWSTRVAQRSRSQRILWQPGFYDRRIRDEAEFDAVVEYVVHNPVAAGLVAAGDDWPWVGVWVES